MSLLLWFWSHFANKSKYDNGKMDQHRVSFGYLFYILMNILLQLATVQYNKNNIFLLHISIQLLILS